MKVIKDLMGRLRRTKRIDGSITASPSENFRWYLERAREINSYVDLARKSLCENISINVGNYLNDIFFKTLDLKFYVKNNVDLGIIPAYYRDISLIFVNETLKEINYIEDIYFGRKVA